MNQVTLPTIVYVEAIKFVLKWIFSKKFRMAYEHREMWKFAIRRVVELRKQLAESETELKNILSKPCPFQNNEKCSMACIHFHGNKPKIVRKDGWTYVTPPWYDSYKCKLWK